MLVTDGRAPARAWFALGSTLGRMLDLLRRCPPPANDLRDEGHYSLIAVARVSEAPPIDHLAFRARVGAWVPTGPWEG